MEPTVMQFRGYLIEIHEHPIYHDFEFVIKSLDGQEVIAASSHQYKVFEDAEVNAKMAIANAGQ